MSKDFSNILKENFNISLNSQQQKAVLHKDGPGVVLAVPGAGKTTVLICRTANLILNHNISPENILSITFSKASAKDMKERFEKVFGTLIKSNIKFSTIHSFAFFLIREYAYLKNIKYTLIEGKKSEFNKIRILKNIYHEVNGGYINDDKLEELLNTIGYIKNMMLDVTDYEDYNIPQIKNFDMLFNKYEEFKKDYNLIDFDDMLSLSLKILKTNSNLLDKYRSKYKYIQVDEGQDTSKVQNEIINLLAYPNNNMFIVADDDQSIYGFRGASPEYLLNFNQKFKNAKTFYMEQNYRSTKNIVSVCNTFIKSNKYRYNKNLFTDNINKRPVTIVKVNDENDQYDYIVEKLGEIRDFSDTAILFRNNISSIALAEKLDKNNIQFYIRDSKLHFFNHWVVNDIVSFLKLSLNKNDTDSFENIYYKMKGYISKVALNYVKTQIDSKSVFDRLISFPEFKYYQVKNIQKLKKEFNKLSEKKPYAAISLIERDLEYGKHLKEYCKKSSFSYEVTKTIMSNLKTIASETSSIIEFLARLDELQLLIKDSKNNKDNNAVTFSTIHSSKGLEFKNVFIIDMIDGEFPTMNSIESFELNNPKYLEEERRLFYVGMTRAKEYLDVITINQKNGERVFYSRFVNELESIMDCSDRVSTATDSWLKVGTKVFHEKFGLGKVRSIEGDSIVINFKSNGIKQLSLDLCLRKNLLKGS